MYEGGQVEVVWAASALDALRRASPLRVIEAIHRKRVPVGQTLTAISRAYARTIEQMCRDAGHPMTPGLAALIGNQLLKVG